MLVRKRIGRYTPKWTEKYGYRPEESFFVEHINKTKSRPASKEKNLLTPDGFTFYFNIDQMNPLFRRTASLATAATAHMANNGFRVNPLPAIIIGNGGFDGLFRQHRTVNLMSR